MTSDENEPHAEAFDGAERAPKAKRREAAVRDALRALLRDHYMGTFGVPAGVTQRAALSLDLKITVHPHDDWRVFFDPPLDEQVEPLLADLQARREVYRPGRVHCFRCDSAECAHAAPPGPLFVFRGYTTTGVPDWCELAQALVEARDERVDQLFSRPPAALARVQLGKELNARQLSTFGRASRTYAILGQVIAGYFEMPAGADTREGARERQAVTFQAVETRDATGRARLRFNVLTGGLSRDEWEERLVSGWNPGLRRALERIGREWERIEARAGGRAAGAKQELARLPNVLRDFARTIERGSRQLSRRTRHAEARRQQRRPVSKALDDARRADAGALFMDERKDTYVVCGKQGRTHVFAADARHVTSFVLAPGGAEFRTRTRRWRGLTPEEILAFRRRLAASIPAGEPEPDAARG